MAASEKPAGQGKDTGGRAGGRPLPRDLDVLHRTHDALHRFAEFEGQPFKRKPIVVGSRPEKAKARRQVRAAAAETGPEAAALAALERQAQELLGMFREVVKRFERRVSSAQPRPTAPKTESGATLTPPRLAERLGISHGGFPQAVVKGKRAR